MADLDLGSSQVGFVDKRLGRGGTGATVVTGIANMQSISTMKARLTAINATSYSPARLAQMTENDMVYALRLNDDLAGV